jgi:hypothetical protein
MDTLQLHRTPLKLKSPTYDKRSSTKPLAANDVRVWLEVRFCQADALPLNQFVSETVLITPEMARYILEHHNLGNRPIKPTRVKKYAKLIKEGRFKVHSQGMSFARTRALNNGQHRLLAIIMAGIAAEVFVVFGEDRGAFEVIDVPGVRGPADTLSIGGYQYSNLLGSALNVLMAIHEDTLANPRQLENDEVLALIDSHPDLHEVVADASRIAQKLTCSKTALAAAFYLIKTKTAHKERYAVFIDRLEKGERDSPVMVLRDGLTTKKRVDDLVRSGNAKAMAQAVAVVRAWRMFIRRQKGSLQKLQWTYGEPFPPVE